MNLYPTLILLHIVATGGVFAGLGIEVTALQRLQHAGTASEARLWSPSLEHPAGMLPHISMVVLVLTGLGLAMQHGGLAVSTVVGTTAGALARARTTTTVAS